MTFKQRVVSAFVVLVAATAVGSVLFSTLRPVQAATVGNSIACFVFANLDDFGTPLQYSAADCPTQPTQGGALTVVNQVINSGAGSATSSDFQIHVMTSGADVAGSPQPGISTGMTYSGIFPGTYTVRVANAPLGYVTTFSGSCDASGTVHVTLGSSALCVITNTFSAPAPTTGTLDVMRFVSGGAATSSKPSIHVLTSSGVDVAGSPQAGTASGTLYILPPGVYSVIESSGIPGYTSIYSGNCSIGGSVAITAGGNASCTITDSPVSSTTSSIAPGSADLSLSSIVSKPVVNRGDIVTLSLVVTNAGPSAASAVAVHDALPSGLIYVSDDSTSSPSAYASSTGVWSIGELGSGSIATLHIAAAVTATTTGMGIANGAVVTSATLDPLLANNVATSTLLVGTDIAAAIAALPPVVGQVAGVSVPAGSSVVTLAQTAIPAQSSACGALLKGFIKPGGTNDPAQVARLQAFLKVYEGASVPVNGVYDAATIAATEAFQAKFKDDILTPWGITAPTGYVYLTTRHMVNEVYCRFSQTFPLSPAEQSVIDAGRAGASRAHAVTVVHHRVTAAPVEVDLNPLAADTATSESSNDGSILNSPLGNVVQFLSDPFGGLVHWLDGILRHT